MGKRTLGRSLIVVLVLFLLLAFVSHLFRDETSWPVGGRTKLPTGPVKPMVALGATHGIILAGDGSLWSWGSNYLGWQVLGQGGMSETPFLHRIGSDTNWVSISSSGSHCLAIKSDGTLWAWGQNLYGQFGNGTKLPMQSGVPMNSPPGNDWKQAEAGGPHSIGLKKDGTIWAWGNNWAGQLGIGVTNDALVPTQIGSGTNWVRIWVGTLQGAAQQADGTIWIWGSNPALTNQPPRTNSNLLAPVKISADTNWVSAAFGQDAFLAVKSDGTLWVWGIAARCYNGGQSFTLNGTMTRVGTNSDWRSVASSHEGRYNLLTKKDGSRWGLEAGFAGPTDAPPPLRLTRIDFSKDVATWNSTRGAMGVAITPDGEVWTWGRALDLRTREHTALEKIASVVRKLGAKDVHWGESQPVVREKPWLLPNFDSDPPK